MPLDPTRETSIELAILGLLSLRGENKSICPSEAARAVDPVGWRDLMGPVREVAGRLVAEGRVAATQRGAAVDPRTARGPIRLRLPDGGA